MTAEPDRDTGEAVELLRALIRNGCVNEGARESGQEVRNADVLHQYLEGSVPLRYYDAAPGRRSLVARLEGYDRGAPSLCLLAHTDVVPALADDWVRDPFGGELVDGEVWGRGAIDMLNMTASMAVALRRLGEDSFRPRGDVVFAAFADEEAQAEYGARYLLEHHRDEVFADYVLTEGGGWPLTGDAAPKLSWASAEKGSSWLRIAVPGTAGHAANPYGADNALVTAAEVVRRLTEHRTQPMLSEIWRDWVHAMEFSQDTSDALLSTAGSGDAETTERGTGIAATAHARTHLTLTPTVVRGGVAINSIPELVEIDVDARTLPGQSRADVVRELRAALGDLFDAVHVRWLHELYTTSSPVDTPLFRSARQAAGELVPGTTLVPSLVTGSTDAEYFRRAGAHAYGFAMTSNYVSPAEFAGMFHGANERIDVHSLGLCTQLWERLARTFQYTEDGMP